MNEPLWLNLQMVQLIHSRQVTKFGGARGTRDEGLLESALSRPLNHLAYTDAQVPELGAIYCIGIVKNHPFVDGNKRAGFMAMYTFLGLNGFDFDTDESAVVEQVRGLAAGEVSEEDFIRWVRDVASERTA